ncbi:OstA-like protein [Echinicola jeungdonensis]|uniref:OstA-like protein n=1 Tax=Echinicola jeungdonensis TaxID=709343 RepID=A0ABV5J8I9_9BACT|nr:OstA-like protein [Echinicola jeungdonensis]MDN3669726.1 OstA-like protein [Echinicola jeungdonensis]
MSSAQTSGTSANNQLEIIQAESLRGGRGFERLIKDVIMKHQNSMIYCDSAHFYSQENIAKLFGNVKIEDQKDPVTTTSHYAEYDGNTRVAKLRTNVVFKNEGTTLYTNFLDYNRNNGIANYFNSGKVVDTTNVLTSEKGLYNTQIEKITFTEDVVLENPEYTLRSNILYYKTVPKTAETEGITNIISKEGNKLNAKKGSFYDTEKKIFRFFEGEVDSEESRVMGETLYYDENKKYYEAQKNVSIFHKERKVEIFGEEGKYWEERKYSKVYGNALVQKYFESDTLYMIADTLISQDSEKASIRYLKAFANMRLIKGDLAGRADSTVYHYSDSTIYLYDDPLLWNNDSQISADSIHFLIANEDIDKAFLRKNAFAITTDTLKNYNQIKGREMTGHFTEGDLTRLDVEGNGESLYFALENDTTMKGLNKLLCGKIFMHFEDGEVVKINHTVKPEASFTPTFMIQEEETRLKGFDWRVDERPTMEIIRNWRTPVRKEADPFNFFLEPDVVIPYPDHEKIQRFL